jgi:hypothetical protein
MIRSYHHSIAVDQRIGKIDKIDQNILGSVRKVMNGGATGRKKWPEDFTMNKGRKIDCMR